MGKHPESSPEVEDVIECEHGVEVCAHLSDDLRTLFESLLPDDRHDKILNFYYKDPNFQAGISKVMKMIKYFESNKQHTYNVVKTTRAGLTTNMVLAALFRNKTLLLVAPTNKILYDTVIESYDLYYDITGDYTKKIRPIPNNVDGCSCVQQKLKEYPKLADLPYISSDTCKDCKKSRAYPFGMSKFPIEMMSTETVCITRTMEEEKEHIKPDILTITYDKFIALKKNKKSSYFKELINSVDIILFDEIGEFLTKTETGLEIEYEEDEEVIETREDYLKDIKKRIKKVKNTHANKMLTHIYDDYLEPFFDKLVFKQQVSNPRIEVNPLSYDMIKTNVQVTEFITKRFVLSKQEAINKKYREYYQTIENMVKEDDADMILINQLLGLLTIMSEPQVMFYKISTAKYVPKRCRVGSTYICTPMQNTIEYLNEWSKNEDQIIIFSDATMPANNLKKYTARKIKSLYYGDPNKTNASLLMYHDNTVDQFSKSAYYLNTDYQINLLNKLYNYVEREEYNNQVIWISSKELAEDIRKKLGRMNVPTCTHENSDEDGVLITYYGSPYTRGVKSTRRYQIMIGKSAKPLDAYKNLAFVHRSEWSFLSEKDMKILADEQMMTVREFKAALKRWFTITKFNGVEIMSNTIPEELFNYFEILVSVIRKEKIYMESWQAVSRAKDPAGKEHSIVICLGLKTEEINEMLKWGRNESICYDVITEKRLLKSQNYANTIPHTMSTENENWVTDWMVGRELPASYIGFNDNFEEGLKQVMIERGTCDLKELWTHFCTSNVEFGAESDTYSNGYFLGSINALIQKGLPAGISYDQLRIHPVNYNFYIDQKADNRKKDRNTTRHITGNEYSHIIEVLRMIYLMKSKDAVNEVSYSDIRKRISVKKISNKDFKYVWELLEINEIFEGSSWSIDGNKITKHSAEEEEKININTVIKKISHGSKIVHDVYDSITDWYFNKREIETWNIENINDDYPEHNYTTIRNQLVTSLNAGFARVVGYGCAQLAGGLNNRDIIWERDVFRI